MKATLLTKAYDHSRRNPILCSQAGYKFHLCGLLKYTYMPCLHHCHLGVELMRMGGGFVILKLINRMLQKILTSHTKYDCHPETDQDFEDDDNSSLNDLPEDVKKGHFVVHTVDGGELRRFVVELSYLAHPGFLKLLEQAEQEFGFKQTGILAIPCRHSDLQSILQSKEFDVEKA